MMWFKFMHIKNSFIYSMPNMLIIFLKFNLLFFIYLFVCFTLFLIHVIQFWMIRTIDSCGIIYEWEYKAMN